MERLTNIGSNGEIWITDNDETRRFGRKESAYKKLAEYEDLDEQGLLFRFPCRAGATVWWLNGKVLMESEVVNFCVDEDGISFVHVRYLHDKEHNRYYGHNLDMDKLGKGWFLSEDEAKAKLLELEKQD